jgi:hypothetical protein
MNPLSHYDPDDPYPESDGSPWRRTPSSTSGW